MEIRQWPALTLRYILDCKFDAAFSPKVSTAASFRPRAAPVRPAATLSHQARCVGLERLQHNLRTTTGGDHGMHVIGAHVYCTQQPVAEHARILNGRLDCITPRGVKLYGFMAK